MEMDVSITFGQGLGSTNNNFGYTGERDDGETHR